MGYQNISSAFFDFVRKHACDTDRQTGGRDGRNYDSKDRASIAVSRGKNCVQNQLNETACAPNPIYTCSYNIKNYKDTP